VDIFNFFHFKKGNLYGAFLIASVALITTLSNSLTHSLPCDFPSQQVLFLKAGLGVFLLSVFRIKDFPKILYTNFLPWHALKGIAGALGNWFWIAAMINLPMADSSALSLTSALLTTLGAAYFFNEHLNKWVISSISIGFIGVLLILHPTSSLFTWYSVYPLLSALAFSTSSLIIKKVSLKDHSFTTLFYLLFFMTIYSAVPSLWSWQVLTGTILIKLFAIAVLYLLGQLALIEAYTYAAAGFIAPFKFVRFPLAIVSGLLFFGEQASFYTLLGGCLIITSYYFVMKAKKMPSYLQQKTKRLD
jgi:drug/metabolite transporter (DMT)-like permease